MRKFVKHYNKNARHLCTCNLADAGRYYHVNVCKVREADEELYGKLLAEGYPVEEWEYVVVSAWDIEAYNIPYECIDWANGYVDGVDQVHILNGLIKEAKHYLVYADGVRWTGESGYQICDNIADTIFRKADASFYPLRASRGGKILICKEFSYDVQQGAKTYIIALTEKEYEKVSRWASFHDAVRFVDKVLQSSFVNGGFSVFYRKERL